MSKHRVAVLKVVSGQLSVTAAAIECRISRGHLHRLLRRYREEGLDRLEPRSRRPHTSPHAVPGGLRERVVSLRVELAARGLDAGPATIAWHLGREGLPVPSTSTIRRILHAAGLVVPEPHKRPRSAWHRFEAAAPNAVWQSDFTHWRLADGSGVEICSWLDDHSRYLLGCRVFRRVSGDDVVATFTAAGDEHGWPAATLTDNGTVYTARLVGGRNGLEHLLAYLGIRQQNGAPGRRVPAGLQRAASAPGARPSDAGGVVPGDPEGPALGSGRARPLPAPLRHHRQQGRHDPAARRPAAPPQDRCGPSPDAGPGHRRRTEVTVVALDTGELLSTHRIEPAKGYWRNTRRDPGRWPGSRATG
jgi:hypothetical protein